ncbi:MAG: hypothetical protein BWX88_00966 [Planctomycetes bacterium ADurb.Bin126]|nr:MAG: hypothetical protein BWX88_00966 [Planctomycetes bacterium ADurb.Bin126]HOD80987.1 hypothetical protein [Phycisphaerae bacterium]HQL73332.1 hypothetical protein [Phycisphaerae bacterium]
MSHEQIILACLLLLPLLVWYMRTTGRFWWWFSASNISVYLWTAVALTTLLLEEEDPARPGQWQMMLVAGVAAMILGCIVASRRRRVRTGQLAREWYQRPVQPLSNRTRILLVVITVTSMAIVAYASLRGDALATIRGILTGGLKEDLADVRKRAVYGEGYGSGDYTAAGYVQQFRDILLPLVYQACFLGALVDRRRGVLVLLAASALTVSALGALAIGQRSSVIIPLAMLTYLCLSRFYCRPQSLSPQANRIMRAAALLLVVAALGVFARMTVALGRADQQATATGALTQAAENVVHRVLVIPAQTDAKSVSILRDHPPGQGVEWARTIVMVLPNRIENELTQNWSEVGTAKWLHVELGGSYEGNAPLGRFASMWFNFRLGGLLLLSFLGGYLTQCYDRWCYRWRKTPLTIAVWQMGAVSIALATTPGTLLLTGLAASLLLLALDRLFSGQPLAIRRPTRSRAEVQACGC